MAGADGAIGLYEADPRGVLPIQGFRIPRSVARALRRSPFEVTVDRDFDGVVAACADRTEGTWLSPELAAAYAGLHRLGAVHTVECRRAGRLVGGLFGVAVGGLFTSESMFHRVPDAGSGALVATAAILARERFVLWDVQELSPHLARFGGREIPAAEYRARLREALGVERRFA
jgi:leucyl/phenylalanyl-tRNA--protein transferase